MFCLKKILVLLDELIKVELPRFRKLVSSVSPSSERIEELWCVVRLYECRGALPLVEIWLHEFANKLVE